MTRRSCSEATLFSLRNEQRRVQSQRFSRRFASIWNRRNQWKEPCFQDWSTSSSLDAGRYWAAADRSPAAGIVWELQVFVILAKDKGDSLRVAPLADEKNARSFTVRRRVRLAPRLRIQKVVNDAFAACVAGYGWVTRQKCYGAYIEFGRFAFRSARHRENIAVAAAADFSQLHDQLQTRATSVWQGIISGWVQWVKDACTSFALCRQTGEDCLWRYNNNFFWPWIRAELYPTPTGLTAWVKNRLKTEQFIDSEWDFFLYLSVWSAGTTSFGCKWRGWLMMRLRKKKTAAQVLRSRSSRGTFRKGWADRSRTMLLIDIRARAQSWAIFVAKDFSLANKQAF